MAKLVRVANQLKAFEVGKPSGFASPVGKDPPPVVDAESKIQETNQGKVKLSQIFQRSKMRRLNGAAQSDPVSPEQKHADGISGPPGVPDYVLCLNCGGFDFHVSIHPDGDA